VYQARRTAAEPGSYQLVSLAEQPVDPDVNIPAWHLDQPVRVQHQRVALPKQAVLGAGARVGNDAEDDASRLG
jgi:hypothetical protein